MKSYVLLGAGSVFGNLTARFLLKQDNVEKVVAIGRNPRLTEAYTLNVGLGDPRYEYHQVHMVFEQDRLFEIFDELEPDVVINFAALAYATSWEKSFRYYETNIVAVAQICEHLMNRNYLKRFLQIGTSELYGPCDRPIPEDYPLNPTSPYAVSKMAADLHLETLWRVKQFPMNIIRPSNAYGPGQYTYRIVPKAAVYGLSGKKFPLEGGGAAQKSFLYADDLAEAIYLICENAEFGKTYNAGVPEPVSMCRIVELVAEELGISFDEFANIVPGRSGEDSVYWLDSSAIKNDLGWEARTPLKEGIGEMVAWARQYLPELSKGAEQFVLRA
jgi:dTDP-glucose 4,6-dehydratase